MQLASASLLGTGTTLGRAEHQQVSSPFVIPHSMRVPQRGHACAIRSLMLCSPLCYPRRAAPHINQMSLP